MDVACCAFALHPRRAQQNCRFAQLDVELFLLRSVLTHDRLRQESQGSC